MSLLIWDVKFMFLLSSLKFWMLALVKVCDWMWSWHLGVKHEGNAAELAQK